MNRTSRFLFALWIIISGSAGAPQPCFADQPITLRGTTEVHRMAVRLSDVFDGIPADMDMDIAQAPAPGKQVSYDANILTRVAQKYGIDWKPQSIADHVVISTACSHITADMIREAVAAKVKETSSSPIKGSVEVAFDNHTLDISLPADHTPDFTLSNFDYDALSHRFHTDLVTNTSSGPYYQSVTGRVTIKRSIPVLARRLEGGTVIGVSDLSQIDVAEDHINGSVVTQPEQLIGRELRHDKDSNDILHAQDIIPPRLVTRGGLVTLKIQTPFMMLTAQGKSLQDGGEGDIVRVTNTQSNRMIEGTVESPGVVLIKTNIQRLAEAQ